jgi:hypothetical protein
LASTKGKADLDYDLTICVLLSVGFTILVKKSVGGGSSHRKEYLGFIIDTSIMMVFVPEHKMVHVLSLLEEFLSPPRRVTHTVREVSSMVGKLVSLKPVLGTEILVTTRLALIEVVAFSEAYHWDYSFLLSDDAVVALREGGGVYFSCRFASCGG